jgi:hypothetical protein
MFHVVATPLVVRGMDLFQAEMEARRTRTPVKRVPHRDRYWPKWNAFRRKDAEIRNQRLFVLMEIRHRRMLHDYLGAKDAHNVVRWKLLRPDNVRLLRNDPQLPLQFDKPRYSYMKKTSKMAQLRDGLVELFHKLERGDISPAVATEMNNAAGKAINSAKVELEYRTEQLRNAGLVVQFMEPEE